MHIISLNNRYHTNSCEHTTVACLYTVALCHQHWANFVNYKAPLINIFVGKNTETVIYLSKIFQTVWRETQPEYSSSDSQRI